MIQRKRSNSYQLKYHPRQLKNDVHWYRKGGIAFVFAFGYNHQEEQIVPSTIYTNDDNDDALNDEQEKSDTSDIKNEIFRRKKRDFGYIHQLNRHLHYIHGGIMWMNI